jgi:hypothetical protein
MKNQDSTAIVRLAKHRQSTAGGDWQLPAGAAAASLSQVDLF